VWQALFDELKHQNFVILAVAMDQPEAARPWIEAAQPSYPCLIDRDHHVADLYGLVNVPQAIWIDESGRIVRPPETAGSTDGFRSMDRTHFTLPEAVVAERNRIKALYLDALRDWAEHGPRSRHALEASAVTARLKPADPAIAAAHAHFRLGQHLLRSSDTTQAQQQFEHAIRLHPDSWNIWRQTAAKDARGLAAGPQFWARVDALGERPYYEPVAIDGHAAKRQSPGASAP
jgi:tetratricopeptide (TPR) repeat protein